MTTNPMVEMTDEEIDNDDTLQMAAVLDRFHAYIDAPYAGRERMADETPLDALHAAQSIQIWLDEVIPDLVAEARKDGAAWREIGIALGMTRQAAWERFTP